MSMPFAHSIRALHTDREGPAVIILISAMLLLALWLLWFLWASIPLYESGQVIGVTRYGALIANFSGQPSTQIQPGQTALIRSLSTVDGVETVQTTPALVMLVNPGGESGELSVELASLSDQWLALERMAADGSPLRADVEVDRLSPAQWIWRASGQWIDTPPVVLNPSSP